MKPDDGGGGNPAVAHQRLIRDALALEAPRPPAPSLAGYCVALVSRDAARPIILRYEWLGTLGQASRFVGLIAPGGELEGVACFGHGPSGDIRDRLGGPALCLERGACVHYAPRNAASFLINRACRLVARQTGVERFYAYGDPMAGEYGAVYQAAGWLYLGQGLSGSRNRPQRVYVLPPGGNPDDPSAWRTTRALRRGGVRMGWEEAEVRGWRIAKREAKHVYATHVGAERKRWRAAMPALPYPAPRPELKLCP